VFSEHPCLSSTFLLCVKSTLQVSVVVVVVVVVVVRGFFCAVRLAVVFIFVLLYRTEDEIGQDNLHDIDVPPDLHEKFQKMDEDFVKD